MENRLLAINLFNGNSAIINFSTASPVGQLKGNSQPRHLGINGDTIYHTSRDGSLTAFDMGSRETVWHQFFVSSDLSLHPSKPGYLLISDLERNRLLIELTGRKLIYKKSISGEWFSPVQVTANTIIYFVKNGLKPNQISAVKIGASAN